jgi:hypothetical protein
MSKVRGKPSSLQAVRLKPAHTDQQVASGSSTDSVTRLSQEYRDLVQALGDGVVEYHAIRRGSEITSRVDYPLQRRVQRQRQSRGDRPADRR